jgi:uncharacterized tellurite resistance protein B-like protein
MNGYSHKAANVCTLALGIAWAGTSGAQQLDEPLAWDDARLPQEVRLAAARFLSHRIHIDGATAPDKLGIADLLRGRLLTIASEKTGLLDDADRALISTFAAEEGATLAQYREAHQRSFRSICASHLDQQPKQLATALTKLEEEEDHDFSSFYQQALDALSPRGRVAVRQYLRREIAPATMKSRMDYAGLASDLPEQLRAQVNRACTTAPAAPITVSRGGQGFTAVDPQTQPQQ